MPAGHIGHVQALCPADIDRATVYLAGGNSKEILPAILDQTDRPVPITRRAAGVGFAQNDLISTAACEIVEIDPDLDRHAACTRVERIVIGDPHNVINAIESQRLADTRKRSRITE